MSEPQDFKNAYEEEKAARLRAEKLLETQSAELQQINATLQEAYDKLQDQQSRLVQQEKLASIGLLAAGVAHEINNPVGFIKSNLETLHEYTRSYTKALLAYQGLATEVSKADLTAAVTRKLNSLNQLLQSTNLEFITKDGVDCIQESLGGVRRVEEIIANLRDFAQSDEDSKRSFGNINDVIDGAVKLVWNEIRYGIELEKDYGELPEIWATVGQLSQVFVNIIMNAAHAMEGQGKITIRTSCDADDVHIDFIDAGPGIEPENLDKLFDPFFTTKEVGSGTGLGLYISHGLIAKHQGSMQAFNEPSAGARFRITLPVDPRKRA